MKSHTLNTFAAHTPSRSPARKRQRLSPQFDEFPTPSQDELRGFDEIEANLFGTDDGSHLRHTSGSLNGAYMIIYTMPLLTSH